VHLQDARDNVATVALNRRRSGLSAFLSAIDAPAASGSAASSVSRKLLSPVIFPRSDHPCISITRSLQRHSRGFSAGVCSDFARRILFRKFVIPKSSRGNYARSRDWTSHSSSSRLRRAARGSPRSIGANGIARYILERNVCVLF